MNAVVKPKKCRICRREFQPRNMLQACCSPDCAITYARLGGEKRQSVAMKRVALAQKREDRDRLRSRREWLKIAQVTFNAYIRERDKYLPCISCHMTSAYGGQWQAGHYRTTAAAPQLRFHEDNCHKQCAQCNGVKSGNLLEYRKNLLVRIGAARVEALENDHSVAKLDVNAIKALIVAYRAKLKELKGKP